MEQARVLIVDDHAVVRAGLRLLLEATGEVCIVGETGTVDEALELAASLTPDVVLLDLTLDDQSGLDLIPRLAEVCPDSAVLVLTMHEDDEHLRLALQRGAAGYVLKHSADTELMSAIRRVLAGDAFVDRSLTHVLVGEIRAPVVEGGSAGTQDRDEPLSERESQVARLVALGHTNKEVGRTLYLSVKTIETYRARVMSKLGLSSRAELVRYALGRGWLEDIDAKDP